MSVIDDIRKIFSKGMVLCNGKTITVRYHSEDEVTDQILYNEDNGSLLDLLDQLDEFSGKIVAGSNIDIIMKTKEEVPSVSFYPLQDTTSDDLDIDDRNYCDYADNLITDVLSKLINEIDCDNQSMSDAANEWTDDNEPDEEYIYRFNELVLESQKLSETVNAKFEIQQPDNIFDGFTLFAFDSGNIRVPRQDIINIDILKRVLSLSSELDMVVNVSKGWFSLLFYA